jgi:hypothetical protein
MVWGLVMHVRLLGPAEIETAVGTVGLGGLRAQAVVGLLAVRAGEMLNALHRGRPLGADIVVHRRCRTPAAHGRLSAENPLFSEIALADGPLIAYDLEQLPRVR